MPVFTQTLIFANVIVYLLQIATGSGLFRTFALWPPGGSGSSLFAPWQLLSYSFLHGNLMHLAFNMVGLWMFGGDLERVWGPRRVAQAYFLSVLTGAVAQIVVAGMLGGAGGPVIGASAGVFGLLLAFALVFPEVRMVPLFLPIPMPARVFVLVYALLELTLGVTGTQAGVAHFAHLGGLAGGWIVYRFARGAPHDWRRRR